MAKKSPLKQRSTKKRADKPSLRLENIALYDCSCHRHGIIPPAMPNVVAIKLSYRSDLSQEDGRRLICKLPIETTAAYAEGQEPALVLRATFAVAFQFDDQLPDDTEDEKFRNVVRNMAIFHVWPYWRQFVHFTTVSMSLPPMQMFPEIPPEMLSNFMTTE